MEPYKAEDAELVLVMIGSAVGTARQVVDRLRDKGHRVGLVKIKMFRPFPREEFLKAVGSAKRIGVLDRNYSPGSGGIFWSEIATTLQDKPNIILQDYLVGVGGTDVTPQMIDELIDDLLRREKAGEPMWKEGAQ